MIKAIIIDDEKHCVTTLTNDLAYFCGDVNVIGKCTSSTEGLKAIRHLKPDLVFLDIEMPHMNGFELLSKLEDHRDFQVIFTTAYDQFMLKALRVSAIDYLLKPIDGQELVEAVKRAEQHLAKNNSTGNRISNLLKNHFKSEDIQRIAFPNRTGYEFVRTSDISHCVAEGSYTSVILTEGREIVLSKPLGETESMLPLQYFIRIHHSILVNKNHIKALRKSNGLTVVMNSGEAFPVARSRREQLLGELGLK